MPVTMTVDVHADITAKSLARAGRNAGRALKFRAAMITLCGAPRQIGEVWSFFHHNHPNKYTRTQETRP